jgi:uncharacterized protein YbbK (DUF523 family)
MSFPQPVVAVSQCLGFAAVRNNGAIVEAEWVQRLAQFVRIIELCPEVGIGLGVPRDPIRLQRNGPGVSLVQPATARDLTTAMHHYSLATLDSLDCVDGFILKSRSPSCGIRGVSIFADAGAEIVDTGAGMFAAAVLERFPHLPVEDELTLRDPDTRANFLTRIFARAAQRIDATPMTTQPFPPELA